MPIGERPGRRTPSTNTVASGGVKATIREPEVLGVSDARCLCLVRWETGRWETGRLETGRLETGRRRVGGALVVGIAAEETTGERPRAVSALVDVAADVGLEVGAHEEWPRVQRDAIHRRHHFHNLVDRALGRTRGELELGLWPP